MFCKSYCASITGIDAIIIKVEADISDGLPGFELVGFLASEVREARERVRVALKNSEFLLPPKRITVNLSPADIRKEGTAFDLSIAAAILAASGFVSQEVIEEIVFLGELSFDGRINPVNGILSMVYAAREEGFKKCVVPLENLEEGTCVEGIEVYGAENLVNVFRWINGGDLLSAAVEGVICRGGEEEEAYTVDFSDVNGQMAAKRAIEVAAAGMHNILLAGPPGAGKTMLAKRIPTILPSLTLEEKIEITKVYSVAGKLTSKGLMHIRPFRSPHHTVTQSALAGGGSVPRPGEISLASKGVLFLDELPEFRREVIEVLRQPLEEKSVTVSRLSATYTYPADFMLVAAMNPCPCGYYPDRKRCSCTENKIRNYLGKISQPLLDRIDICIEVAAIDYKELENYNVSESSEKIRERIEKAIKLQKKRYEKEGILFNSQLTGKMIERYCIMEASAKEFLAAAFEKMQLSARAYHRILKVARTIADLDECEELQCNHISEAVCYRGADKKTLHI